MAINKKKDQIFTAAAKLFIEHGFKATSMRQLAKEVGLEASSLYSHISSKQELLAQMCMSEATKYLANLDQVMSVEKDIINVLRSISYFHIETAFEDPVSETVFTNEWRYLEEPTLSEFKRIRKDYESRILHVIAQGVNQSILIDKDPFILFQLFQSSFKWIYMYNKPSKWNKEDVKHTLTEVLLKGIKK